MNRPHMNRPHRITRMTQRVRGPKDTNGNRREMTLAYVIYNEGSVTTTAFNTGQHESNLPVNFRSSPELPSIHVTLDEWDTLRITYAAASWSDNDEDALRLKRIFQ